MESPSGLDGLLSDLERQRAFFVGRAPAYARLLALVPAELDDGAIRAALVDAWAARRFPSFYDRPLLLLAALRADALAAGPAHPLWRALGTEGSDESVVTSERIADALAVTRTTLWRALRVRRVQTNETSRAVAWLWPAALAGATDGARSLVLVDVGASAGLNLVADALPSPWRDARGRALPVAAHPRVELRLGLDAHPLDVTKTEDAMWLEACVWPGDAERLARLRQSIAAFKQASAGPEPPRLEVGDVLAAPPRLVALSDERPRALVLAYQTVVRGYLGADGDRRYEAQMLAWLRRAAGRAVWIELEPDAALTREPATPGAPQPAGELAVLLGARVCDGDRVLALPLARTTPHPLVLDVAAGPAQTLARLLQRS